MQIWGLCDEYNNVQSFSSIQKKSSEIFHFLEFYINLCPRCDLLIALTTASLNVGWVPRSPGAFSLSSQLLHETAPWLANPGNPAMTPLLEGKKGTHHTDMIYTVETGGGDNPKTMPKHKTSQKTNTRDPCACGQQKTINYTGLPLLAQSMHWWCRFMNEHSKMQRNTDPCPMHWCQYLLKHCWARRNIINMTNALARMHNNSTDP